MKGYTGRSREILLQTKDIAEDNGFPGAARDRGLSLGAGVTS